MPKKVDVFFASLQASGVIPNSLAPNNFGELF